MTDIRKVENAHADFALRLFQKLSNNEDNVFMSPYSISVAMAMVLLGSRENTANEVKNVLGFAEICDKDLHGGNLEILKQISKSDRNVILETANKLFPEKSYKLSTEFVEECLKFYQSEVGSLDFIQAPEEARNHINEWAQKQTRDKIKNLLPPGSINSLVRLVIANAVYFKGDWHRQFKENETTEADFHVNEGKTIKVKMMSQKSKFFINFSQDLRVQVLELPYKGEKVSMILLVPTDRFGLKKLEESLTSENLRQLTAGFSKEEVVISLPRMKLEWQSDLVSTLQGMGMHNVFDAGNANLQGISGKPDLFVSAVAHKAFIEVNEEGSEAAAATAVVAMLRSMPIPPIRVTCDHPFMFLIKHKPTQSILFIGRCMSP